MIKFAFICLEKNEIINCSVPFLGNGFTFSLNFDQNWQTYPKLQHLYQELQ